MLISLEAARSLLPKVGDVRMEIPTIGKSSTCMENISTTPLECTVIYVNAAHLWYRVKFKDSGFTECYKVPRLKLGPQGRLL
jgi:hypothetical protein